MDLILLFILAIRVKKLALKKGQPPLQWRVRLIVLFLLLEVFGVIIGVIIHHDAILAKQHLDRIIPLVQLLGIGFAFGGYLLVRHRLIALPDKSQSWQDRIGKV